MALESGSGDPKFFLVYVSSATRPFSEEDLRVFLETCRKNNAARLGSPEEAGRFFGRTIRSGSHPASVRLVADGGAADAASIDSNVLRLLLERTPALKDEVRVLDSWGPYPIQPVVMRTGLDQALKAALRESLLGTEADPRTRLELEAFGPKRFAAVGEEDYDAARRPRPSPGGSVRIPGDLIHPTA